MQSSGKTNLFGLDLVEMAAILTRAGYPGVNPALLAHLVYKKTGRQVSEINNYPLKLRNYILEHCEISFPLPERTVQSIDGCEKFLFGNESGLVYESVRIPEEKRLTVCISSQSGCRHGCRFCNTGLMGFRGHLGTTEILGQLPGTGIRPTHVVLMGMGEPLDNYTAVKKAVDIMTAGWGMALAARSVTLSTVGLIPQIEQACRELTCNIAISLHSPFAGERSALIPAENRHPVSGIIEILRKQEFLRKRRLSFEYLLIKGLNDSKNHAMATARLLQGLICHVNLIPYNPVPGLAFEAPGPGTTENFRQSLNDGGLRVTIRKSRGHDIAAACGMMAALTS